MVSSILSHLTAAICPLLFFFLIMRIVRRTRIKRYRDDFWDRQSVEALNKIEFWGIEKLPEPLKITTERDCINMALQTISSLLELGLFELLAQKQGMTEEEIKEYLRISTQKVRAVISILIASEVIMTNINGYQITEKTRIYLLKESPFFTPLISTLPARHFLKSLRIDRKKGARVRWDKGKSYEPERLAMQQHLHSFALGFALYKLGILDDVRDILDVAGGAGSVCIALALSDHTLTFKMIELPDSIEVAEKMISKYGLKDRIKRIGMDMFVNDWPGNVDVILFTNIFHDWDDDRCQILARKAFEALKPGGLIILQEALLYDDNTGPLWTAHWSMTMALFTQGRQFHVSEIKTLLSSNSFSNIQIHPLLGYYSAVVGVKPR